jgi:radical SAM superfamily enzyme YgiQ (UPF0313 family)
MMAVMSDVSSIFPLIQHRLSRGGLWSRGGEIGTLDPAEADRRDFSILLARLSNYENTSLSFTHTLLYSLFADNGWYPDWAFLPTAQDREVYAEAGIPWLFGIQSKRTAREFDAIGVSNSITQELGNLFWFLKNSGIPIKKSERMTDPELPLIIMGGANSGSASVLFHPDPPVDGIFTGEDLGLIAKLFRTIQEGRARGATKPEILSELESIDGFFQSDKPRAIKKMNARTLGTSALYAKMPVAWGEGNPGKAILPISEGCAGFCSFCNESFVRKPYREASVDDLLAEARVLKAETGADTVDLFSFNFNMHEDLFRLIDGLVAIFPIIGLKSQRFDSIAEDPTLVEIEKALGKSVYTCGLEGISERLRRFLNKNLTEAQVRKSMEVLVAQAVREIKVFLIATGREEETDYAEWSELLGWIRELRTPQGKQVRFVFSITPLVRFPHTPLEFEPVPDRDAMRAIIKRIVAVTEKAGFECREAASVEEAMFSDRLLRADRPEVLDAFAETVLESGFVYEREVPERIWNLFEKKLAARGIDPESSRRDFSSDKNAQSPWALIDMGVSRQYLENQYARNSAYGEIEPDPVALCGRGRPRPSRQAIEAFKQKVALAKKDEIAISFPCDLAFRYANIPREYPALYIASALMKAEPALVALYRGYDSSFWQKERETPAPLAGLDRISLKFRSGARALLSTRDDAFWKRVNDALKLHGIAIAKPDGGTGVDCALALRGPFDVNADWLVKGGLKHVYAKVADGRYAWQFTKDALKKGIIVSLAIDRREAGAFVVTVVPGPKFDLTDFLRNAFKTTDKNDWQRIRVEAIAPGHAK